MSYLRRCTCIVLSLCLLSFISAAEKLHFQQYITNNGDSAQIYISNIAIETCVKMCKLRRACRFINYRRSVHGCFIVQMYSRNSNFFAKVRSGYICGDKSEWDMNDFTECSSCTYTETCYQLNNGTTCSITSCPRPQSIGNATIYGNKHVVGSVLQYKCNTNYSTNNYTTEFTTCLANGSWTHTDLTCLPITTTTTTSTTSTTTTTTTPTTTALSTTTTTTPPPTTSTTTTTTTTTTPTTTSTTTTTTTTTAPYVFVCQSYNEVFRTQRLSDGTMFTYIVVRKDELQAQAYTTCINKYSAALVEISTQAKMEFLRQLANCQGYKGGDYWIDGTTVDGGDWKTATGTLLPMSSSFWSPNTPNGGHGTTKHCVRLKQQVDYYWDDIPCSYKYYYICERVLSSG